MSKNIEQLVKKYFRRKIFQVRRLTPNKHFDGAVGCAEKNYINEARADDLAANVGLKNFTIAHELGHWVLHRHLFGAHRVCKIKFATINTMSVCRN